MLLYFLFFLIFLSRVIKQQLLISNNEPYKSCRTYQTDEPGKLMTCFNSVKLIFFSIKLTPKFIITVKFEINIVKLILKKTVSYALK